MNEPLVAPLVSRRGDDELLRRVLDEGQVDQQREAAGVSEYLYDAWSTAFAALNDLLEQVVPGLAPWLRWLEIVLPWLLGAFAVAIVLLVLVRLWRSRRPTSSADVEVEAAASAAEHSAPAWEARLRARLDAGDGHGALEALWWWLAQRLGAQSADASWTARELVLRSDRGDLLTWVRRFDRLAYGTHRVPAGAVEALWRELDGRLQSAEAT